MIFLRCYFTCITVGLVVFKVVLCFENVILECFDCYFCALVCAFVLFREAVPNLWDIVEYSTFVKCYLDVVWVSLGSVCLVSCENIMDLYWCLFFVGLFY